MRRTIAICAAVIVLMTVGGTEAAAPGTSEIVVMLGGYGDVALADGSYRCTNEDFESGACPPLTRPVGSTLTFTAAPGPISVPGTFPVATAPVASRFVGWSAPECEGSGRCTMHVDDDEEAIVAHFSPAWLELLVNRSDDDETTVAVSGKAPEYCTTDDCLVGLFAAGARLNVTATPPPALSDWAFGCDPFDSDLVAGRCVIEISNIRNFVSLTLDETAPQDPPFNLRKPVTVKRAGNGKGRVQGAGTDASGKQWRINCGTDCKLRDIQYQSRIRLRAEAASGSEFARWAGPPCGSRKVCTFTAGKYPTARATFQPVATVSKAPSPQPSPSPTRVPPEVKAFKVSVSRATARGRRAKRRIVVTVTTNRSARATLRLTRRGRRVVRKRFALRAGTRTIRVTVPRRARGGWYRLSLVVVAADGSRESFARRLHLRR